MLISAAVQVLGLTAIDEQPRRVFTILRHHLKKNRRQVDALAPPGTALQTTDIANLVRRLMESRPHDENLTVEEVTLVEALVEADALPCMERAYFEGVVKMCRCIQDTFLQVRFVQIAAQGPEMLR